MKIILYAALEAIGAFIVTLVLASAVVAMTFAPAWGHPPFQRYAEKQACHHVGFERGFLAASNIVSYHAMNERLSKDRGEKWQELEDKLMEERKKILDSIDEYDLRCFK